MKIAVVGTGYVGLVTGVVFADLGNEVLCVDIDAAKVDAINKGQSPIYEPGLDDLLQRNLEENRLRATTDLARGARVGSHLYLRGHPADRNGRA
jgi:UDPglucose 6-dehydrogenase